jgi:3'(2'), 5'-bisphosphate nucleotidase
VLDPIDGTKGFLRGDQYCVALALVDAGEVVLGVLGCPRLGADGSLPAPQQGDGPPAGALLYAVKSAGAYRVPLTGGEETRLSTDAFRDAEKAVLCESVESAHADHDIHRKIAEVAGIQRPSLRVDSQVKYAAVASGLASAYLRIPKESGYREKIWDHAAGAVVVTEAGGRVTDLTGKPLDFTRGRTLAENPGILVTGGPVHDTLLAAVKTVLFSPR